MSPDAPRSAAAKMAHARAGRQTIDKAKDYRTARARLAELPSVDVLGLSAEELAEGAVVTIAEGAELVGPISHQAFRQWLSRNGVPVYRDRRGRRVVLTAVLDETPAPRAQAARIAEIERCRAWARFYADPRNLTSDMTAADQARLVALWEDRAREAEGPTRADDAESAGCVPGKLARARQAKAAKASVATVASS
jgi:hypothetical protein